MSALPLPLRGVRVVDVSQFVAGPSAARCLAALGAEVIKADPDIAGLERDGVLHSAPASATER